MTAQQAPPEFPLRAARTAWRNWSHNVAESKAQPDLDIGIVSSFTADALGPYLGHALLSAAWSPRIRFAPFNQIFQTLSAPQAAFNATHSLGSGRSGNHAASTPSASRILLLLPRLDELVATELARFCGGDSSAWPDAQQKLAELAGAVATARKTWPGTFIVGTFPPPATPEFDFLSLDRLGALFFQKASAFWRDAMAAISGLAVLDLAALAVDVGFRQAFDARMWYLYRQPFSEQFLFELGAAAARLITALHRPARKCAVIDCDNTIWGGIIGEDGLDGIKLGDEFPGSAYRDFQRLLLHWRRQGALLAVCSKNNPEDVRQVFRKHQAMLLKESDISGWAIGWQPKSEQLQEIARQLNIGVDSLVLFDDSAYEIGEVLSRSPSVRCIQLPAAPELIVSTARRAMPFEKVEITNEDRSRAQLYAVETQRNELRQSLSIGDFVKSLELRVDTVPASPDNLARIAQLIKKTNQFNLTGLRLTQDHVQAMSRSDNHIIRAATVSDKFGEYGLTCVGILEARDTDWHLLVFLLSCRVLGRGVETRFLADLTSEASAKGGARLTAEFNPSDRNAVSADFLAQHGFIKLESGLWSRSIAEPVVSATLSVKS